MPLFLSRKAKDQKGLSAIQGGGSYTIRSNNKIANPTGTGTLSRGTKVKVSMSKETVTKPGPVQPMGYEKKTISVPKKTFIPGDMNPGTKINDRPTTIALGKKLNEHPEKTAARMKAQTMGQTSYISKSGKPEYSGRVATTYSDKTINAPSPKMSKPLTETISKKNITLEKPSGKANPSGQNKGLTVKLRRTAGNNSKGQGQNFKELEVGIGNKTMHIARFKTKTHRSK